MDDLPEVRPASADALLLAFGSAALGAARHETGALRRSADPDAVHRARAALRRLRTVLLLLRPAHGKALRPFRRPLRSLSHALGEVRDLDVFAETLLDLEADRPVHTAAIVAWAESRRRQALDRLLAALPADETNDPLAGLAAWFDDAAAGDDWRPAGRILDRSWRALRRGGKHIERGGPKARHKARIRARRLQVGLEILAPPLAAAGDPGAAFSERLASLQRRLGDLNDIANARRLLGELRKGEDRPPRAKLRKIKKALKARGRRLKRRAAADFEALVAARKAGPWPPLAPASPLLRETT